MIQLFETNTYQTIFLFDLQTGIFLHTDSVLKNAITDRSNKSNNIGSTFIFPTEFYTISQDNEQATPNFDDGAFILHFTPNALDVEDGAGGYDGVWGLVDKKIKGAFFRKADGVLHKEILGKDLNLFTEKTPEYPVLEGDVLFFDELKNEWAYLETSHATNALLIKNRQDFLKTKLNEIFLVACQDDSEIDLHFSIGAQQMKMVTKINLLSKIIRQSLDRTDKQIEFNGFNSDYFFSISKTDLQKRELIIGTLLNKISLFKRKRAELFAAGASKIKSLTTISELDSFSINLGDFDADGQANGWGFIDNRMRLTLSEVKDIEISVSKYVNGLKVDVIGAEYDAIISSMEVL